MIDGDGTIVGNAFGGVCSRGNRVRDAGHSTSFVVSPLVDPNQSLASYRGQNSPAVSNAFVDGANDEEKYEEDMKGLRKIGRRVAVAALAVTLIGAGYKAYQYLSINPSQPAPMNVQTQVQRGPQ